MRRTLAFLGGILLAIALSQFPEYAQQYTQRLGGAVDELAIIAAEFDTAATDAGLTREAAIARFSQSGDSFLSGRGESMARTFARHAELSRLLADIRNADPLERLMRLPAYADTEIGLRTLENFRPAVPVTPEGFLYAGAGFFIGSLLVSALLWLLVLPFRRRRVVYRERI
ncbi:DUF2937 family protein [Arsenicitalea aurantiaca]|uniref:DUF2937 family protein n=1 Tax=Arsenicitalea aurantiaca TaxID=1783274 RepID=A0A433X8B0_9HYPH|nr:DUF2937 family protein [Arsenicitalea aurantiaca]RUT30292.1 DUF2937 family protein [Arsenicitalea aurantiaca]